MRKQQRRAIGRASAAARMPVTFREEYGICEVSQAAVAEAAAVAAVVAFAVVVLAVKAAASRLSAVVHEAIPHSSLCDFPP